MTYSPVTQTAWGLWGQYIPLEFIIRNIHTTLGKTLRVLIRDTQIRSIMYEDIRWGDMLTLDGVICWLWLWTLCLVSEPLSFFHKCHPTHEYEGCTVRAQWGRNEEEQRSHCELNDSEAGRHSNKDLPDKWTYSKQNILRTLPKAKKMRLHNEKRLQS